MEHPRELSAAIARANAIREREAVRVVGWVAAGIAAFCWSLGGFFLFMLPDVVVFDQPVVTTPVLRAVLVFGCAASAGCALAARSLRVRGERITHSMLALILNGLFLVAALAHVIRWL